jgi:hypothetical protein
MAKIVTSPVPAVPGTTFPRIDLDAVFALHRANLAAAREAYDVLVEAAEAVAKAQYGWVEQAVAALSGHKGPVTPEAILAGVKDAAEQAFAVARQGAEIGTGAQKRVADLVAARTAANVEASKAALAA